MRNKSRNLPLPIPPLREPEPVSPNIVCGNRSLRFSDSKPGRFTLLQGDELLLQGELSITINDEPVDTGEICWRNRQHPNRLEKWVNLDSHNQLSLNITYYLTDNALVIDYLARCSPPSWIAIRHRLRTHSQWLDEEKGVQLLPDAIADRVSLSRYQRNDEPSQLAGKPGVHLCKEAFSATQSIRFSEKCELDKRT